MDLQFAKLASQNHLEVNLVGVANSKKMFLNADGLNLDSAIAQMMEKGEAMSLKSFYETMVSFNLSNSIFVDCTSSEDVAEFYERILSANISIVTPNKKANSGSLERYKKLKSTVAKRGVKFLYETNVGAGLPVINTLNDLLISGDKALRIEAVLSGTLNFIFSSFTEGKIFSEVVKEAKEKGYTEPDPRDDLNGMDVARKALILAREIGLELELKDVEVENLVPEKCRGDMKVDEFFSRLSTFNADFDSLRNQAQAKNEKLRYMAILENGMAKVSLASVNASHPFYSLSGSDNIILLTTERYKERPMVIRGPGAGAEVTAAGVFADVIRIGNY
jgi:bifunctional aspartokinase / homoserine dehydrogenase 1